MSRKFRVAVLKRKWRLRDPPPCRCGYGVKKRGDEVAIVCHGPFCQQLAWLAETSRRGYCNQCLKRLRVERGAGWLRRWCPGGHTSEFRQSLSERP